MKRGLFIAIEGIDGCGKSSQVTLLGQHYANLGLPILVTGEVTDGPIGQLFRDGLKDYGFPISHEENPLTGGNIFDEQLNYLAVADRFHHWHHPTKGLFTHINSGVNVICDRSYISTLVYGCHDNESRRRVIKMHYGIPAPDLIIYLDVPVGVALERLGMRGNEDAYENGAKLSVVEQNYRTVFTDIGQKAYNGPLAIIDATHSKSDVHHRIVHSIPSYIGREQLNLIG